MNYRTFIALTLPPALHPALHAAQNRLRRALEPAPGPRAEPLADLLRWTRAESIHLTLRFVGETPRAQLENMVRTLAEALASAPSFRLQVGGLGCFPNPRRPQVLWLGTHVPSAHAPADANQPLHHVQQRVEHSVRGLGFAPELKAFRPHLTLARLHRRADAARQAAIGRSLFGDAPAIASSPELARVGEPFLVQEVILFRSELPGKGGGHPVYTPLARFKLDAPAP